MLRRLVLLAFVLAAATLLITGSGAAARSAAPAADLYLGEWTPDTTSNAATQGHAFTLQSSDEASARALTGNSAGAFDDYCKSSYPGVQPVTYFTVTTTWSNATELGGCQSGKTGGHVYAWTSTQIWYAHYGLIGGVPKLIGVWEPTGNRNVSDKFTADHPAARFLTNIKYTRVVKAGSHVAALTSMSGVGEVAVTGAGSNCIGETIQGGSGLLHVRIVKIGGPSIVELDALTVAVIPGGHYESCDTQELLLGLPVEVKTSDPSEKDKCPVGSQGELFLGDRSAQYGGDTMHLEIDKCDIHANFSQGKAKKGSHVAVAVTFDEKGY